MVRPAIARLTASFLLAGYACAQLPAQTDTLTDEINQALERARPALMAHLKPDGGPRNRMFGRDNRPGLLALLCLAALHDGVPADDPVLKPALLRLSRASTEATYDLSLRLMVAEACPTFPDRDKIARQDAAVLLQSREGGMFGYNPGNSRPDLSNTQYAALGLRAAATMGVKIESQVWRDLLNAVGNMQDYDGGFSYTPGNRSAAYPSMTVAGISVVEICRQALEKPGQTVPKVTTMLKKGWSWMEKNAASIGSPVTHWCYYFHYGLERAAILSDVTRVAGNDWYRTGARMMVKEQLADGNFGSVRSMAPMLRRDGEGDPVNTAFAVLFLRRAFKKLPAPVTPGSAPVLAGLDDQSTPLDLRAVATALVARGRLALPEVLKALRCEVVQRRRAAAMALRELSGQDFGYQPELDEETNRAALMRAELWYLKQRDPVVAK